MFHYAAVRNGDTNAIYECEKDEDVEVWECEGEKVFPYFDGCVEFETDHKLNTDQEYGVVSLEYFNNTIMSSQTQVERIFFESIEDIDECISERIHNITGWNRPCRYKQQYHKFYSNEIHIAKWTICILQIVGPVRPDPRRGHYKTKFEVCGIKYKLDIDPIESGFIEMYNMHILPWIKDYFKDTETIFEEDVVLRRRVLPFLAQLLVKNGAKRFSDPNFFRENEREIHDSLEVIFD
jgi:hypothetical protein